MNFEKCPDETAKPSVTAGLRYASLLPHAIAVNTPAITAKAQPAVITIQPEPSAFDRFSTTLATTPSPSRINTRVPINSPRNGDAILVFLSCYLSFVSPPIPILDCWDGSSQSKVLLTARFQ